jgi:hypothetical protein
MENQKTKNQGETMTEPKTNESKTGKPGTLWLSGRIQSSQQVGTDKENFPIIENIIITPAQDVFSHPNRYCVMSRSKFGNKDQDITIEAEVQCRPWKDTKGRWHYPHYLWAI